MIHMKHLLIVFFICIFHQVFVFYGYSVIPGNSPQPTATFDFPVAQFIGTVDSLVVVSADVDGAKDFSLSFINSKSNSFKPMCLEEVILNRVKTTNPLFNKKVQFISLVEKDQGKSLFVVPNDATPNVYLIGDITNPNSMLSNEGIPDANGSISSGIVALNSVSTSQAYVAVKPAEGIFGDPYSGINVVKTISQKVKINDTEETWVVLARGDKAIIFDKTAPSLIIQNPLTTLQEPVSLWWDSKHEFLYAGVGNAIAGDHIGDGVKSVALGINNLIKIGSFILRSIFDGHMNFEGLGNNSIIVAGPSGQLSVHHLATMVTSTSKYSLIVVGGNGAPDNTRNTVYAIPLVPFGNYRGLVANKYNTQERAFNVEQCVTNTDPQARIGNGPLLAGPIASLSIRGDSVFVTVAQGGNAGVYFSRALFNAKGDIVGWTQWARATSITQPTYASSLDLSTSTTFMLTSDTTTNNTIPNTIVRTAWGDGSELSFAPVISLVNGLFPEDKGGVQGIYNFSSTTPGLDAITLLTVLGKNRIALIQTGEGTDVIQPTSADTFKEVVNNNGTITMTSNDQTIMIVEGGILNDIGPLTSIALAHSKEIQDTWIFIAGSHGVAVLQKPDGSGCGDAIGAHLSGITEGMAYKLFGNYQFVRKLIADGEYLYILTDTYLDRITLSSDIQQSVVTTIAQIPTPGLISKPSVFTDCAISNSVGLLATSTQLLHTAVNSRITDAIPRWQAIAIPESEIPIMALYPITVTGNQSDFARGVGSNIHILSGNNYRNLSIINRFAIKGLQEGAVVEQDTVQPFLVDQFIKGKPSYFIDYGETENIYGTDGALTFAVHNKQGNTRTTVKIPLATSLPMNGVRFTGVRSQPLHDVVPNNANIAALVQNSATGSWLIGGTMGMRVNE